MKTLLPPTWKQQQSAYHPNQEKNTDSYGESIVLREKLNNLKEVSLLRKVTHQMLTQRNLRKFCENKHIPKRTLRIHSR